MTSIVRAAIGVVIAFLVVLILISFMPRYNLEPHGVVLPLVKSNSQPYRGDVQIYDDITAPFNTKTIGAITVMYHTRSQSPDDINLIITKAKQLAAAAGGSGIIVAESGFTNSHDPLQVALLKGHVIRASSVDSRIEK